MANAKDSEPEELLWLIINRSRAPDERVELFEKLARIPWLGDDMAPYMLWLFRQVHRAFGAAGVLDDEEELKDIVQDIHLKLWNEIRTGGTRNFNTVVERGEYRPGELTRILVNRVQWLIRAEKTDYFRRLKREKQLVPLEEIEGQELEYGLYEVESVEAECRKAKDLVSKLGADTTVVRIMDLWIDGYTYEEIAQKLGKSESAIKQHVHRWEKAIREEREGKPRRKLTIKGKTEEQAMPPIKRLRKKQLPKKEVEKPEQDSQVIQPDGQASELQ